MALKGICIDETHEVISKHEPDPEDPTIFIFGVLTNIEKLDLLTASENFKKDKGNITKMYESSLALVKKHLKKIKNFNGKDHEGNGISPVVNSLSLEIVLDLSEQVIKNNFIQDKERKN